MLNNQSSPISHNSQRHLLRYLISFAKFPTLAFFMFVGFLQNKETALIFLYN